MTFEPPPPSDPMQIEIDPRLPTPVILVSLVVSVLIAWITAPVAMDPVTINHLECAAACEQWGLKSWSTTECVCDNPPRPELSPPPEDTGDTG